MKIEMPVPNERQKLLFQSRKKITIFGGARGGGKSWSVRWKALLLCMRYAGIKVLIMRRTYPELVKNHITQLKSMTQRKSNYWRQH